ncbi:VWA domain-containing protein [Paracoccus beibuensis]|uniref:VWA domain-containing protein n=1 Tax=Paracoccus beibuensis TaxID=547602 RepID=UPI0022400F0C|nr:VWA domain-containing protein [Paracoccus beibuensis]
MSLSLPFLLILLPLPLLVRWLTPPVNRPRPALRIPDHLAPGLRSSGLTAPGHPWLAAAAWVLLVVALAGPQIERQADVIPSSGRDVMLALDLSGSMEKEDFTLDGQAVSRLQAVKRTAADFVARREGDRVGLVIFGARAYVAAPLTFDVGAVAMAIDEAQIGISGRGTAISDGLGLAMRRLDNSDARSRVIVLLSDGVDTSGSVPATEVARLATEHGIRIHTVALGPEDLETQPTSRDAVDVATLRQIAEMAGGEIFRVRGTADLEAMAQSLDRLEPSPGDRPPLRYQQQLWHGPTACALILLAVAIWRRRE